LILLVSGDSCADLNFRSGAHPEIDFSDMTKWPEHLAEELGMELVCLAKSGSGNQYIYHTILNQLMKYESPKDEVGLVIAGWSQAMRKDVQVDDRWCNVRINPDGNLRGWVNMTLRTMFSFQVLCERYELPYFHFQMGDLFEAYLDGIRMTENERRVMNEQKGNITLIEKGQAPSLGYKRLRYEGDADLHRKQIIRSMSEYDSMINNFVGWPPLRKDGMNPDLGGFNIHEKLLGLSLEQQLKKGWIISAEDEHPNGEGHKGIADFLKEYYESKH